MNKAIAEQLAADGAFRQHVPHDFEDLQQYCEMWCRSDMKAFNTLSPLGAALIDDAFERVNWIKVASHVIEALVSLAS